MNQTLSLILLLLVMAAFLGAVVYMIWKLLSAANTYEKRSVNFSVKPGEIVANGQIITGSWRHGHVYPVRVFKIEDLNANPDNHGIAGNSFCVILDGNKKLVKKLPITLNGVTPAESGMIRTNFTVTLDLSGIAPIGSGFLRLTKGALTLGGDLPVMFT